LLALANGGTGAYNSTDSGATWQELSIANLGQSSSQVLFNDTFSMSITCSNKSSHVFTTNVVSRVFTVPGNVITNQNILVTNTIGVKWAKTTVKGKTTLKIIDSLGINEQGKNVFGVSPVYTNLLGTNVLGIGFVVPSLTVKQSAASVIPNGTGAINTNLLNVLATNISGIKLVISNVLNIKSITTNAVQQSWSAIASSADGSKLVAAANGGFIYASTNFGATWKANGTSQYWSAVASSADGTKLVATVKNGGIFTSTNSGATWGANAVPSQDWSAVYSSPDGNTLVALSRSGWSYKSTNGGVTWNELSAPYDFWQSVASSASGSNVLAASHGGYIYGSTNAGTTWRQFNTMLGTNVISTDAISLTVISTNSSSHAVATNLFSTSLTGTTAISSNIVKINNSIGINVIGATITGTNLANVIAGGGVLVQGSNTNAFEGDPVPTLALGTNLLAVGSVIPNSTDLNLQTFYLTVPDITGVVITNTLSVNNITLTNLLTNSVSDIHMGISNVLNLNVVIANIRQSWSAVASSADGSHLAAAVNGGLIYISTNSGTTWFATSAPSTNWSALVMSADGSQLTAAVNGGLIYSSTDSGASWVAANVPVSNWRAVATSADGAEMVAVVHGGVLYTEQSPLGATPHTMAIAMVPALQIQVANGNVVLSWAAGATNVVLQQSSNIMGTVWGDLPTTPVVTNGQNQVTLPMSTGNCLYRLKQP
jgi:hypothetical protein